MAKKYTSRAQILERAKQRKLTGAQIRRFIREHARLAERAAAQVDLTPYPDLQEAQEQGGIHLFAVFAEDGQQRPALAFRVAAEADFVEQPLGYYGLAPTYQTLFISQEIQVDWETFLGTIKSQEEKA